LASETVVPKQYSATHRTTLDSKINNRGRIGEIPKFENKSQKVRTNHSTPRLSKRSWANSSALETFASLESPLFSAQIRTS
jgi:hypothetical protein